MSRPASPEPDIRSTERQEFCAQRDASITTNFPLAKAALSYLGEIYPRAVRFDELLLQAFRLLDPDSPQNDQQPDEERQLAELLLKAYGVGVVEFHLHVPEFTPIPGERPLASPLARYQAQHGTITTSLLGINVRIEDFLGLQFLLLLDGTRDRTALIRDFSEVINSNVQPATDGTADDKAKLLRELPERLEERLNDLGRRGFLLA
jgi:methyltransferase-like protein